MTNATANATATVIPRQPPREDLLFVAHRSAHFRHLTAAIKQAGLNDVLTGVGPYTVFAPNDKAFDRLARSMLTDLLKPENKTRLATLLMLHIVAGRIPAAVPGGDAVTVASLIGEELTLDSAHGLRVNRARIVIPGIEASNGLIHEIDTVLFPGMG
jgi:uncharacterized surface protein with fasciclin (FAS1) repeats